MFIIQIEQTVHRIWLPFFSLCGTTLPDTMWFCVGSASRGSLGSLSVNSSLLSTVYVQIFEVCKFRGFQTFSVFVIIFSRITSPSQICRFHESLINVQPCVLHMHVTLSLFNYLFLSTMRSRSPCLVTHPLISGLMH